MYSSLQKPQCEHCCWMLAIGAAPRAAELKRTSVG